MMADCITGANLPAYLEETGWKSFVVNRDNPRSPLVPGRVRYFSTMGHIREFWHRDGRWIAWGIEWALVPSLCEPLPVVTNGRNKWAIDPQAAQRWMDATPAEEVVEALLRPNFTIPYEYATHGKD